MPVRERVLGAEHPATLDHPRQPGLLDRGGGGCGGGPRPVRRAAAGPRAGPGRRAPRHADTRANLAYWTGEAGDAAARDQYAALLPVRERVLGAEHPATLTTCAGLADWTGEAGDAAAARDQYAALVPVRERVLGAEHPAMLTARASLADWAGEAGDAAAARDQFAALLPVRERVLGAEHPATLTTRASLAPGPGGRGMRPRPGTSTPRWCRSASGSWALSTPTR